MSTPTVASDAQSVDDVLASIRKLVSDEAQAQSESVARSALQSTEDAPLVLTPELKVANTSKDEALVLNEPVATVQPTQESAPPAKAEADEGEHSDTSDPSATIDQSAEDVSGNSAPFHDEVALRALVSEMIRDELQGELGNRITRNVRRMVRREIEAALKVRNLT